MDHQKILSNLETWDKIRDAIPKMLEISDKFGVCSSNTAIDFDSINHKYILIKFRQDENSSKTFKPEKGHNYHDDEIEVDDQNRG
jgi:hypothetical protein